jgi:hypothetical protein
MKKSKDNQLLAEAYLQIYEANIFSKGAISSTIDELTKEKNVDDRRVIDWLKKAEEKYFQDSSYDDANIGSGILTPHARTPDEPEWASKTYDINYTSERKNFLNHVIDFFKSKDDDYLNKLSKKTPKDIYLSEVPAWDAEMSRNAKQAENSLVLNVDYKVVYSWNDGMKMIEHITKKACEFEGNTMGHCAGGYDPGQLLSLWDKKNEPHVTLEITKSKSVKQIKGKANAAPVDKYKPYIIEFIKKFKLKVIGDGRNIGMSQYDKTYYFPDSAEWQKIYKEKIAPVQDAKIKEILANIITVNENYRLSLKYSKLL